MILPKKMAQLRCLKTPEDKMALLRDICLCVGITIHLGSSSPLVLENDSQKMKEMISASVQAQQAQMQKKKKQPSLPTVLSDEEIFVYENLPFHDSNVVDFYPILKTIPFQNKDVSALIQEGKTALGQDMLEKAFENYSQAANILMQISGALNPEVASCISKMANIQFRLGDNLQAVELLSKSIIIQEKVLGFDSPTVAYSYSNLGLYFHTCQFFSKGFECMHRSLKILQASCGHNHPDLSSIFLNLGLMY